MKNILNTLLAFTVISFSSCISKSGHHNSVNGKLIDMSDLSGCTWLIELDNGQLLNPLNIREFNFEKSNGLKVSFDYEEIKEVVTICMSGKTVQLNSIHISSE